MRAFGLSQFHCISGLLVSDGKSRRKLFEIGRVLKVPWEPFDFPNFTACLDSNILVKNEWNHIIIFT